MVVCIIRALKIKEHYYFIENSAYFVMETELLLTV